MARFRHRESGANVSATRLTSPKEIEAKGKGWITAGSGNWEIVSVDVPGAKHEVLEDHEFREQYEATDHNAEKVLAAPSPSELTQQLQHEAPAPPEHSATQALPKGKTAADYAAKRRKTQEEAIAAEKAKAEDPITGEPIDPADDTAEPADDAGDPEVDVTGGLGADDAGDDAGAGEEDLSLPMPEEPPAEEPKPKKKSSSKKKKSKK